MLARTWASLLKQKLLPLLILTAAFAAPVIITNYLGSPSVGFAKGTALPSLLNIASGLLFLALPFAVCRVVTGDAAGPAISKTFRQFGQVLRYFAMAISRVLVAAIIAAGPALLYRLATGRRDMAAAIAVWGACMSIAAEYIRLRLLVVPPMLVATGAGRKAAARFSRRVTRRGDVAWLFALVEGIPVVAASLLRFALPQAAASWLSTGVSVATAGPSAILAAALWMQEESAGREAAGEGMGVPAGSQGPNPPDAR